MRAYFLNSRTNKHGAVNVLIDERTLEKFVGGTSIRNLVKVNDCQYLVIADGKGRKSAIRNDGEFLRGNLLIISFVDLFDDRDMTEEEVINVSNAFETVEVDGGCQCEVLMYERGTM